MQIEFTVHAVPVAQPRQRYSVRGKGVKAFVMNYTPSKHPVQDFKASCRMAAAEAYDGPPLEGPLHLEARFVMPRPGKLLKTKPNPRYPHAKAPDLDNLYKSVADALEGIVYKNDSQIAKAYISKWVASGDDRPHVWLLFWEIE